MEIQFSFVRDCSSYLTLIHGDAIFLLDGLLLWFLYEVSENPQNYSAHL